MRTGTVNIHGKEYMICFSTRVIVQIEEKYGDYTKGLESILSGGKASDVFWLLAEMIEAGSRYARMEGMADAGTLTLDELLDTMGLDDFQSAFAAVTQTTKDGLTPHVEVEPAKNAKTTPEK